MGGERVPVFFINLASRPDRRQFMETQFAALGIAAEHVPAIVASDVAPDLVAAARWPDGSYRIGPGEIACTQSHFAAWRLAIQRGAAACAVLEDDAVMARGLPLLLRELGAALPAGIDLLKLETIGSAVQLGRDEIRIGPFTAQRLLSTHFGSCGYIISTHLASELLTRMPLTSMPIDHFVFGRNGDVLFTHAIYQSLPALTVQLMNRPAEDKSGVAGSDLRQLRAFAPRRPRTRLQHLRQDLIAGWRSLRAFGAEALNRRTNILFADDA